MTIKMQLFITAGTVLTILPLIHRTTSAPISPRQLISTANGLRNGACAPVTVIFARGTFEMGNIGLIVGPPLESAMQDALGGAANVAFQGVDYPADIPGFLQGGDPDGAKTMAALAQQAATDCPTRQIVMSGYSQGAQVVSLATAQLPASVTSKINAVVLFGNPNGPDTPVPNVDQAKTKIFCALGDNICEGGILGLAPHLSYGADAGPAAAFVKEKVKI